MHRRKQLIAFAAALLVASSLGPAGAADKERPPVVALDEPKYGAYDPGREAGEHLTALLTPAGDKPADGRLPGLERGIIGVTGDPVGGYTVRVGAEESLQAIRSLVLSGLSLEAQQYIRLEPTPVSASELQAAWLDVQAHGSKVLTGAGAYWMDVDPALAKVVVGVDRATASEEQVKLLEGLAPGLVQVLLEEAGARSERSVADSAPHWGGSIISPDYSNSYCTAGFTVIRNSNDNRASVTAGHCGTPGGDGGDFYSGPYFYGTKGGTYNYPEYDQARLQSSSYSYYIRTNGGDDGQSTRQVRGATDPVIGDLVCQAGVTSYAECGIEIGSLTAKFCDNAGCTTYLASGRRANDTVVFRLGDSGGPVYLRFDNAEAGIRGMAIAYGDGGRRMFAERWDSMANHLNIRIAAP